jgi:7,8-dihydro-6-hydroxymethylpterin dimethyltransferase
MHICSGLKMKLERQARKMNTAGVCYCPDCVRKLDGRVTVDEHVWLVRHCPEHGRKKTMLFESPAFLSEALAIANASNQVARQTALIVEVTERCDVGCATCSASSTIAGSDLSAQEIVTLALKRAETIGAKVIALSGGEPLMREDLWEIADQLHRSVPKIVVITSGRGFEADQRISKKIAARAAWLEIYLQFDSLRDDVLLALRTPLITSELRKKRLKQAVETGAATTAVCVVSPDSSEQEIGTILPRCWGCRCNLSTVTSPWAPPSP